MKTKSFEIRDAGTFIPVFAVQMLPDNESQRYLLRRSGYGFDDPLVVLCRMDCDGNAHQASYDIYGWGMARTMQVAHQHITENFDSLQDGAVIDVEFILGLTEKPKISESVDYGIAVSGEEYP